MRCWKQGRIPNKSRRDAETLLLHVLGRNLAWLIAHSNDELAPDLNARFHHLLARRQRGEPIQYITGECEFYGLPFRVTPDVLIPRPETEHLVETALQFASGWSHPRILDVGTGSGAIAVALAKTLPGAQITAVDLSAAALTIARENAQQNEVADRIEFQQSDLLTRVEGEFELIVSNPPYVPITDRANLSVEVREYEPALALFAGEDGLDDLSAADSVWHSPLLVPGGFAADGDRLRSIGASRSSFERCRVCRESSLWPICRGFRASQPARNGPDRSPVARPEHLTAHAV